MVAIVGIVAIVGMVVMILGGRGAVKTTPYSTALPAGGENIAGQAIGGVDIVGVVSDKHTLPPCKISSCCTGLTGKRTCEIKGCTWTGSLEEGSCDVSGS